MKRIRRNLRHHWCRRGLSDSGYSRCRRCRSCRHVFLLLPGMVFLVLLFHPVQALVLGGSAESAAVAKHRAQCSVDVRIGVPTDDFRRPGQVENGAAMRHDLGAFAKLSSSESDDALTGIVLEEDVASNNLASRHYDELEGSLASVEIQDAAKEACVVEVTRETTKR